MDRQGPCPKCGCTERYAGYGFAGGVFGAYELCEKCDVTLSLWPETEGISENEQKEMQEAAKAILDKVWGPE